MVRYSLVLLATVAVFNGCSSGECCEKGIAPIAVIAGLGAGQTLVTDSFTLGDGGSSDSDGTVSSRTWSVDGVEVESGYTLPVGTHDVCLVVTDNDGLTDKTCGKVTINEVINVAPTAVITAPLTCDAGEIVNISGTGSNDSDGSVASYAWTPSSITGATGTITCPASGTQEVCLSVTDDGGKDSSEVCKTITVNTVIPPVFGLIATPDGIPPDGYNILCSSDGTAITIGAGTDIQEVYWEVTYNTSPEAPSTTNWTQTAWNAIDNLDGSDRADHFCGKWVGGNNWEDGDTIDISATVLNNDDVNTTYQFTIGSDGNITGPN